MIRSQLKTKEEIFFSPPGFEPWFPGTKSRKLFHQKALNQVVQKSGPVLQFNQMLQKEVVFLQFNKILFIQ